MHYNSHLSHADVDLSCHSRYTHKLGIRSLQHNILLSEPAWSFNREPNNHFKIIEQCNWYLGKIGNLILTKQPQKENTGLIKIPVSQKDFNSYLYPKFKASFSPQKSVISMSIMSRKFK